VSGHRTVACGQCGPRVLQVAQLEQVVAARQHLAEVDDVGPAGQHVGQPELLPGRGVRVAGQADGEPGAAQVDGDRPPVADALDAAAGVAQRHEPLEELG
jgi:hypothetical protein